MPIMKATQLTPGMRVRFRKDSPLHASGARTGTITTTNETFAAVGRRLAREHGMREIEMLRLLRNRSGLDRSRQEKLERTVLPVVRIDPGEGIPEAFEFPCEAQQLDPIAD
jgi:hypothetical protein